MFSSPPANGNWSLSTATVTPSDELDGGCFWRLEEIRENIGKGVFTPNFEGEISKVIPDL